MNSNAFVNAKEDKEKEQYEYLQDTNQVLVSVARNLHGLILDFAHPPPQLKFSLQIEELEKQLESLRTYSENIVQYSLKQREEKVKMDCGYEDIKCKYENLQVEWDKQQEHLGRFQGEVYKLRNQLQHQSQFCASLGSILGNLIWKASRMPTVVDMLLSGNKVGEFLCIVNGTLMSFMDTYENAMPGQTADESQFIMALAGIVTNIAAAPAGRQFLVTNQNGVDLILQFLTIIPRIPSPSGNCLKRLLLMTLYNISINQIGLQMLQESPLVLKILSQLLNDESNQELRLMAVRILQSITYEIDSTQILTEIEIAVPTCLIQSLTLSSCEETALTAREVLENLERAHARHGTCGPSNVPPEPNPVPCEEPLEMPINKCYFVQPMDDMKSARCCNL